MSAPPFSPRRLRVADSFPLKGESVAQLFFLPPLWGKVSPEARSAKGDGRGVSVKASCAALPPLETAFSTPRQTPWSARRSADASPPGGRGVAKAGEQLYCRTARNPLESKGEAK